MASWNRRSAGFLCSKPLQMDELIRLLESPGSTRNGAWFNDYGYAL